jgi:hypothetical protein
MGAAVISEIQGLAEELAEPHVHVEMVQYWSPSRNKKWRTHRTTQPGLLRQLHLAAVAPPVRGPDDVGGGSAGKPESRLPLALEAFSRWMDVKKAIENWCTTLALPRPTSPESGIRAIITTLAILDLDTLEAIAQDFKTWRRWAAVMTGWDQKILTPSISCPVCTSFRSIRIRCDLGEGFCSECQHSWDSLEDLRMLGQKAAA